MKPFHENLVHTEKSMHYFWWMMTSIVYMVGFFISISLLIGPAMLLLIYKQYGFILLAILMPVGVWLWRSLLRSYKTVIWKNKNNSQFIISDNQLTYKIVDKDTRKINTGQISLSSIQYVVASNYYLNNSHLYTDVSGTTHKRYYPILYVVFEESSSEKLLSIRFFNNHSIKNWLLYLQNINIPLYYAFTEPHFDTKADDLKLHRLLDRSTLVKFNIKKDSSWVWLSIKLQSAALNKVNTYETVESHSASQTNQLKKLTFRKWYQTAISVYLVITFGAIFAVYLAENGWIGYNNPLPGFTILFIASILYFWLLRDYFRWFYMIFFIIESFMIFLLSALFISEENTTPIIEEAVTSLLASAMLFPFLIWLPYLIMSYVRKIKKSR